MPRDTEARIAVVGAGMAGLTAAHALHGRGFAVTVFDKSRGLGGRMATRRIEGLAFDHGAQFFTARDPDFDREVRAWGEHGIVGPWQPEGYSTTAAPWWVGTPRMTALARHLGAGLEVRGEATVSRVERQADGWHVTDGTAAHGPFDAVVVAAPAPQAVPLLAASPRLAALAATASMQPCWAALVAFAARLDAPDVLRPEVGPIAWAARNASKPGRDGAEAWVLHANPGWSEATLERAPADVLPDLLDAFAAALRHPLPTPTFAAAHRWRYALAAAPLGEPCLFDPAGLAACGDWCLGGRVEAAFLSGRAAAERIAAWALDRA